MVDQSILLIKESGVFMKSCAKNVGENEDLYAAVGDF